MPITRKPLTTIHLFAALLLFALLSGCSSPDAPQALKDGFLKLTFSPSSQTQAKIQALNDVTSLRISVNNSENNEILWNALTIPVVFDEGRLFINPVIIPVGNYRITSLFLLNSNNEIIYLTPTQEANPDLVHLVETPLPMNFSISESNTSSINVEVIAKNDISLEEFGYVGIDFQEVNYFHFQVSVIENSTGDPIPYTIELHTDGELAYTATGQSGIKSCYLIENGNSVTITIKTTGYDDHSQIFSMENLKAMQEPVQFIIGAPAITRFWGNVNIGSQAELNRFGTLAVSHIEGDLILKNTTELTPLGHLRHLSGNMYFGDPIDYDGGGNTLSNFNGLANLSEIGQSLTAYGIESLISFKGLEGLKKIQALDLFGLQNLKNLGGMENLEEAQVVSISFCNKLVSVDKFKSLRKVSSLLSLSNNSSLEDFCQLQQILADHVPENLDISNNKDGISLTLEDIRNLDCN
ncbi:MAG: hypothetical protein MI784_09130 [Cytophagales bacterium]|nr:hypothetical protein [Cytophagales bacterium]